MDSLTQAALGASVAYACWHKPLGKKALLWGAVLGTLPDLDIVAYPLLDTVERLYWHRGESHSVWFIFLGALVGAFFLHRWRWREHISFERLFWGIVAVFGTHVLIDYFTIYGTQLLAPFSRYGFAHGNMFIIDPLYTLPLLFGIGFALVYNSPKANFTGLWISSLYALFSLASHGYAHHVFTKDLARQGLHVNASITMATPFNTLLWRHLAQTPEGLLMGYYSLLSPRPIVYERVKQHKELLAPFGDDASIRAVEWFSKGFLVVQKENDGIRLSDARFGEIRSSIDAPPHTWGYLFSWTLQKDGSPMQRAPRAEQNLKEALHATYQRLMGAH
ncbi:MAG: metal-dependent hydrolase [Campylobacterales bacterium]|nr:metal-dependent hydrolase [Campylobacterales bacterium]